MPEPEFFILFVVTGFVFAVAATIGYFIFQWGRRKNSTAIKWLSAVPVACGLIVFAPMLLLLLSWIVYWIFG